MKKTFTLLFAVVFIVFLTNCSKSPTTPNPIMTNAKMYFPFSGIPYWKIYYYAPFGDSTMYQYAIDSVYLSTDTVELNILSNNNTLSTPTKFNILKTYRVGIKFGKLVWDTAGTFNYSIIRIDTSNQKIYGINTINFVSPNEPPSYPTPYSFNERIIYDHTLLDNDTAYIKTVWYYYSCDVHLDSVAFGSSFIKKQYFTDKSNPNDTVCKRMQLGCILNSVYNNISAIPNCARQPNAMVLKIEFYKNNADSIEIIEDTDIYP